MTRGYIKKVGNTVSIDGQPFEASSIKRFTDCTISGHFNCSGRASRRHLHWANRHPKLLKIGIPVVWGIVGG